jgi:hypothetical protein
MNDQDRANPVPRLRLVARDGKPVVDRVPAIDAPETKLFVSFRGITEEEQRAALEAFPGGKRFVLVREAS